MDNKPRARLYLKLLLCSCLLLWHFEIKSQYHLSGSRYNSTIQTGIAAKLTIEVQKGALHPRLGLDAGLGLPLITGHVMPAFHLEYELYYGGLGTRSGWMSSKNNLTSDIIASAMLTAGIKDRQYPMNLRDISNRNQPLYYFTDQVQPALQNPFNTSVSFGTNFVWPLDPNKRVHQYQRVGYVNLHITRFQLGYYNDGGGLETLFLPIKTMFLGDGKDRYYTGGGFISLTLPSNYQINTLTASYHKFSGYYPEAFENTNEMNLSFVNYKDTTQQYYNKSYWNISIGSTRTGLSAFLRIDNPYNRGDFQNTIHYVMSDGYHQIPYPRYYSWGVSYFNLTQKTGTK
jgi:hypothetical protein